MNKVIDLITKYEGFKDKAYKCPAGVWTIGYGSTYYLDNSKVKQDDVITKAMALELLEAVINEIEIQILKVVQVPLNKNQLGALISFTYNLGIGNLKSSTLLRRLNNGDYNVGNEFLKWDKCNGKRLKGLTNRRNDEKKLFELPIS